MHQIDTESIEYQRKFGVTSTGDKRLDVVMAESYTFPNLCIADIVDHYKEGVRIYLTDARHAKEIYEAICNHTSYWRHAMVGFLNMGDSPIEDLIAMERFAAAVYEKAKFEYIKKPDMTAVTGTLADFLYNGSHLSGTTYDASNNLLMSGILKDKTYIKNSNHEPNINVFRDALMNLAGDQHGTRGL